MVRYLRLVMVAAAAVFLTCAGVAVVGELRRHTPPFLDARGLPKPGSVAVMERIDLGGSLQSVWIRGVDRRKPLLVLLHGGPGASESALFRAYVPQLEEHFVVVYWEQRGTGRSWLPAAGREALSTRQLLLDLDALVRHVSARFGQQQVVLLGHSWGTVLGARYAAEHPERVAHLVGVAQVVQYVEGQRVEQDFIRQRARLRGDAEVLRELDSIGPPPLDVPRLLRQGELSERYGGVFHGRMRTHDLLLAALGTSEAAPVDLALFGLGNRFSLEKLWPECIRVDLMRTHRALQVPVTVMLGRHDGHVPPELARQWFDALRAPSKRLVWFEHSAHNPPFEEPQAFVSAMMEVLR